MRLRHGLRSRTRSIAESLGVADHLRRSYVQARLVGERLKFAAVGRPNPSSAILLVGSGRSGTTWMTDVLCAPGRTQQIFEPLHPFFNAEVARLQDMHGVAPNSAVPVYLRPWERSDAWRDLLRRVLSGQVRNYLTDFTRNSWFPDRFVIKVIRAHLMVGYISQHFQPKIVFLMRHPCAVVHSRLQVKWRADVKHLLSQEQLVEDHLRPWLKDIERETDTVGANAVYWAVENRVALSQLRGKAHRRVYYEETLLEPQRSALETLSWLGTSTTQPPNKLAAALARPSRLSNGRIRYASRLDRLTKWRTTLSESDQQRVLRWARMLLPGHYDERPIPLPLRDRLPETQPAQLG